MSFIIQPTHSPTDSYASGAEKHALAEVVNKLSLLMEPESSLLCLQEPAVPCHSNTLNINLLITCRHIKWCIKLQ
jgi:hypothetical protein